MKNYLWLTLAASFILTFGHKNSSAGFLDKINAATKKLNEKTQQMQQQQINSGSDRNPDGTCKYRSATCMDYNVTMNNCLAPLNGYRVKLTADLIEDKLKTEELTDAQRKNLEEDLVALREAEKNKTDTVTIAGEKNSQRHLMDISQDDQVTINTEFGKKYQEITNKCMGADHMGVGHRTEMNYVQDNSEDMKQRAKSDQVMTDLQSCMGKMQGLRWQIIAEKLEDRMKTQSNLSSQDRQAWEEDITAVKEAGEKGLMMPKTKDPSQSSRYMMRMTMDDQMALNQEYAAKSQEMIAQCSAQADKDGKVKEKDYTKGGGLVDHSKSPANKKAEKHIPKADRGNAKVPTRVGGGSLSSVLGATKVDYLVGANKCFEKGKGHYAKVTADKLEAKLKAASGISDQIRREWEEDIAAWRAAEQAGADSPEPLDPDNPYRWYDYVTNAERQQINQQHVAFVNQLNQECTADADPMGTAKKRK